jgi:hypothetical protein
LDVNEAEKAFRLCLSWTVRFLIVGGGGSGVLDRNYGLRAKEISAREITRADELAAAMSSIIHNDPTFKEAFAIASVSKINLARYYLRAIDLYLTEDPYPQFIPSEDTLAVNAEHVLPLTPNAEWDTKPDVVVSYSKKLGNLVLMGAKDNVKIGNKKFADKKLVYEASPFITTQWVAEYSKWGQDEITERQKRLAEVAPMVWPISL